MELKEGACPMCGVNAWRPAGIYMKCTGCGVDHVVPQEVRGYHKFAKLIVERDAAAEKASKSTAKRVAAQKTPEQ